MFYRFRKAKLNTANFITSWIDKLPLLLGSHSGEKPMPDFLIIGLPKCGTWWLATLIGAHPGIEIRTNPWEKDKGEVRYFSKNFYRPIREYFQLFDKKKTNHLLFEKSPDYCLISKMRIRFIRHLNPDLKIILLLRNPVDRSFSHAKMNLDRKQNIGLEREDLYKKHFLTTSRRYNYQDIIQKWKSVFNDNVLVMDIGLVSTGHEHMNKVWKFLSVTPHNTSNLDPINTTKNLVLREDLKSYLETLEKENVEFHRKFVESEMERA